MSIPARYVYASNGSVYITNGSTAGTVLLKAAGSGFNAGGSFGLLNTSTVLFAASAGGTGTAGTDDQLWSTNGSAAGTTLITTLPSSTTAGTPDHDEGISTFVSFGAKTFFTYSDGSGTTTLYVTDGTAAGTIALPNSNLGFADIYGVLNGDMLFTSSSGLVVTDGTVAGTTVIKAASASFASISSVVALGNGEALFVASANGSGGGSLGSNQLWITNGTASGTTLVTTLPDNTPSSTGTSFASGEMVGLVNGKAIIAYADGSDGTSIDSLYASNGTASGTVLLPDASGYISGANLNSSTFIFATSSGLYSTNGTAAGTTLIKANTGGFYPEKFTALSNGDLLFTVAPTQPTFPNGGDTQLWITDGTAAGTSELESLPSASSTGTIDPIGLLTSGYLFTYNSGASGQPTYGNLFSSTGTTAANVQLTTSGYESFDYQDEAFLACFVAGTRIATPGGERAVETLRVGDPVLTARGEIRDVVWLGRRHVDCRRHRNLEPVRPIRICAGAFAEGLPRRDLLLSPDHAIYADGVLIPIRYLVNHVTIRPEPAASVTYYHVELSGHDVLLAEGLPAESYLDSGNRSQFEGPTYPLHADFATLNWDQACAPLCVSGPELRQVRAALRQRAMALGWRMARAAPTLHVAGRMLRPIGDGRVQRFMLPAGAQEVMIRSECAQPAALDPDSDDRRWLGVAISGVLLDGCPIPLSSDRLVDGFHPIEHSWRWTNGCGVLKLRPARWLELQVVAGAKVWGVPGSGAEAAA